MGGASKMDEFSEKFQKVFDLTPSPHFGKIMLHFFIFMLKKPCLKVKNLQHKFLDWKCPPPFGTFPKLHLFWYRHPSLRTKQFLEGYGHSNFKNLFEFDFKKKTRMFSLSLGSNISFFVFQNRNGTNWQSLCQVKIKCNRLTIFVHCKWR